eukprot:1132375_1
MGNEVSSKESSKEVPNPLVDNLLPWKCINCNKSNDSNPKFCDECYAQNPVLNPPSFVNDLASNKPSKVAEDDVKDPNDNRLKESLLSIQVVRSKVDKYFAIERYEPPHGAVAKPLVLPVIHISNGADYMETIEFNISLVKKYRFDGVWLIDHNFGNAMHLVNTIKQVRKKYPKLWIGANFLGFDRDTLVPFLIQNELIVHHHTNSKGKSQSKSENILNGLWVDNGGIRIKNEHEKAKDNTDDYNYNLAAFRALQFTHYKINDFLYFGELTSSIKDKCIRQAILNDIQRRYVNWAPLHQLDLWMLFVHRGKGQEYPLT